MSTRPDVTSARRGISSSSVLLPEPVAPTMPSVAPEGTVTEMSSSTGRGASPERAGYAKLTCSIVMPRPPLVGGKVATTRGATGSAIAAFASRMSSRRVIDAAPRWNSDVTQPNAINGQVRFARYRPNATNAPTLIVPSTTCAPPKPITAAAPSPAKNVKLGPIIALSRTSATLRSR